MMFHDTRTVWHQPCMCWRQPAVGFAMAIGIGSYRYLKQAATSMKIQMTHPKWVPANQPSQQIDLSRPILNGATCLFFSRRV